MTNVIVRRLPVCVGPRASAAARIGGVFANNPSWIVIQASDKHKGLSPGNFRDARHDRKQDH